MSKVWFILVKVPADGNEEPGLSCRNGRGSVHDVQDFNHQVFAEDIAIIERQFPEDLMIDRQAEAHFPADRSSIAYRRGLAEIGLGRSYTA
jgi:hypothetical protein